MFADILEKYMNIFIIILYVYILYSYDFKENTQLLLVITGVFIYIIYNNKAFRPKIIEGNTPMPLDVVMTIPALPSDLVTTHILPNMDVFGVAFATDIALALGIGEGRIIVTDIREDPVEVDYTVAPDLDGIQVANDDLVAAVSLPIAFATIQGSTTLPEEIKTVFSTDISANSVVSVSGAQQVATGSTTAVGSTTSVGSTTAVGSTTVASPATTAVGSTTVASPATTAAGSTTVASPATVAAGSTVAGGASQSATSIFINEVREAADRLAAEEAERRGAVDAAATRAVALAAASLNLESPGVNILQGPEIELPDIGLNIDVGEILTMNNSQELTKLKERIVELENKIGDLDDVETENVLRERIMDLEIETDKWNQKGLEESNDGEKSLRQRKVRSFSDYKTTTPMGMYDGMCFDHLKKENTYSLADEDEVNTFLGTSIPLNVPTSNHSKLNGPSVDGNDGSVKRLNMFETNNTSISCCENSPYLSSNGCVCITSDQEDYLVNRGGNHE